MAAVLASSSCCCHNVELVNQESLSFSNSISVSKFSNSMKPRCSYPTRTDEDFRFRVRMQETESASNLGVNGRSVKMVPASEVVKRRTQSKEKVKKVNGFTNNKVEKVKVNGSVVNGATIVKRSRASSSSSLVMMPKVGASKELPPLDELKVLPTDEGFSWANENYNSLQRSIDVWSFVISFRIRVLFDNAKWAYLGGLTEDKQKNRRQKTASWLRERVLQLGPTFIKLGQLSSTRSDLFPREFVDELAKLQDRVPAFSPDKARRFIESELGAPINILFKKFEDQPIAAASLGQVHRAILHNGEKVIVKVQRPGLKKLFDIDLQSLNASNASAGRRSSVVGRRSSVVS